MSEGTTTRTRPNGTSRSADHRIEPWLLARWSPRAMSGERISTDERDRLFEAARWAPSTYNEQEWRFLFAERGGRYWSEFLELLADGNRPWCENAGMLVVLASRKHLRRNGEPNPVHSVDAGAAMQNFLLQGSAMDLVVHPMAGFDRTRTRETLDIPEGFSVEAMIAVGRPGNPEDLPEPLREAERRASGRIPIEEFAAEGPFRFDDEDRKRDGE